MLSVIYAWASFILNIASTPFMLGVFMLSVAMLNVVILSIVPPGQTQSPAYCWHWEREKMFFFKLNN
jgi:hypothetical protein